MNETKYADLSQKLEESEKQLYKKISEECANYFETEIEDSIEKIKSNVDSMVEVVDKVNSCISVINDILSSFEVLKSSLESFAIFKEDFLTASDEQSRLINELKEEQFKQKKKYLLGLIPAIFIIVLQIINILG